MKADVTKLSALFQLKRQFEVPFFQRPYVWSQIDHWQPLWNDIIKVVRNRQDGVYKPHFLGAVILDQENNPPTPGLDRRQIIDGQQRIITLQLVLTAARDIAREQGYDDIFGQLRGLVSNPDYLDLEDRPKVLPIRPDNGDFSKLIFQDPHVREETSNIVSCYLFFRSAISDWIGTGDTHQQFKELIDAIETYLQIVVIFIDGDDDAQVIFETLNNRGQKLAKADLIWNFLVRESRKPANQPNNLEERETRAEFLFQDRYWREDEVIGRTFVPRIDSFMMHFLSMKQVKFIAIRDIYEEFIDWFEEEIERTSFQEIVDDILRYGKIHSDWHTAAADTEEGQLRESLNLLGLMTVQPLILWLFGLEEFELARSDRIQIMRDVESYLFRRLMAGLTSSGYNRHFISVLAHIKGRVGVADNLRRQLLNYEELTTRWPTDYELQKSLREDKFAGRVRGDRVKFILTRVNEQMWQDGVDGIIMDETQVEFLMPRRWDSSDWPLPDDSEELKEKRNHLINSIGNLTLVSSRLPKSVSDGDWETKRTAILQGSPYALNHELPELWNEEEIIYRSQELAKAICLVWPRPEAPGTL